MSSGDKFSDLQIPLGGNPVEKAIGETAEELNRCGVKAGDLVRVTVIGGVRTIYVNGKAAMTTT